MVPMGIHIGPITTYRTNDFSEMYWHGVEIVPTPHGSILRPARAHMGPILAHMGPIWIRAHMESIWIRAHMESMACQHI